MATNVHFEAATIEHLEELALGLRDEVATELQALGYSSPREALLECFQRSDCAFVALFGDVVAAAFGVAPRDDGEGGATLWLLSGRAVDRHPLLLARHARVVLSAVLAAYPRLSTWVDARCASSVKWARLLGFEVGAPKPYGPSGKPFHPVTVEARAPSGPN